MKRQLPMKYVVKLTTEDLAKSNWVYTLSITQALAEEDPRIVSLGSSQCLRWIDQLNGNDDIELVAKQLKKKIRKLCQGGQEEINKAEIKEIRNRLKRLLFVEDYLLLHIDKKKEYDRANKGFTVNGIKYRRLLGTSGGVKTSTIVYVSERIYPKLKARLDNNRKMDMKLVPAKLEAYQALICSASVPVPMPNGIIVVPDCITHFKDDVILLDNDQEGEPLLTEVDGYEIEHNGSDGFGLMTPAYASKVARRLEFSDEPISGFTCRYAWTKGMLYTFDFVEFAEKVAGTYTVKDVWGTERDVRDAEVILTESMLKLWAGYDSIEQFLECSEANDYEFAATKTTDYELDPVRELNYQFLQSYEFTDEEIEELCKPTVDTINAVLGGDVNALKIYLTNWKYVNPGIINDATDSIVKALLLNDETINDPYLISRVLQMTDNWCNAAKRGRIMVEGAFVPISGDPYALCESMFGLEIHGLLAAGEIYHKYWMDKGVDEVVCFRAPMTCHNNIRKVRLNKSEECQYWYQWMPSVSIQNNWDTMCDAMNGSDFDGDTNFVTNNPVLLRNTRNDKTIICVQRQAAKVIPTERDIIKANKIGFSDRIGTITNYITSMFDVRAGFPKDSPEYKELTYRIMAGQGYQQGAIDAIKGIVTSPMPAYWYDIRKCIPSEKNPISEEESEWQKKLCAFRKPYFMIYVYRKTRKSYKDHKKAYDSIARFLYYDLGINNMEDLIAYENKNDDMQETINKYLKWMPVGFDNCVVNRISRHLESQISPLRMYYRKGNPHFDWSIYKSRNAPEMKFNKKALRNLIRQYVKQSQETFVENSLSLASHECLDRAVFARLQCLNICPNIETLVNEIVDFTYGQGKFRLFVWNVFGDVVIKNVMANTGNSYKVPIRDRSGDYLFKGKSYSLVDVLPEEMNSEEIDDYN